jgi:hypothetical protein
MPILYPDIIYGSLNIDTLILKILAWVDLKLSIFIKDLKVD